jgi:hypothetical protein
MLADLRLGRELLHRSGQETELVALWIGENHPRHVWSLAHVDPTSAESEQSVELFSRGAAVGPQINVEPVLAGFGLGYRQEVDPGSHAVSRTDREVGLVLVDDGPAQDVAPEQRHRFGVDGVDTQDCKLTGHPSIMAEPFEPVEAADRLKAQRSRGPEVAGYAAPQAIRLSRKTARESARRSEVSANT